MEKGARAVLVGGGVRDAFLGREPPDWDVATDAVPSDVASWFPRVVRAGEKHGTIMVLTNGMPVEVTTFRGEGAYLDGRRPESVTFLKDLEADLARRNLTINAIAYDIAARAIVDPFGGEADLRRGIVRAVGDAAARFGEDGLRPLRAVRFAATLGFAVDEATRAALASAFTTFERVAWERKRVEMEKLIGNGVQLAAPVQLLKASGMLGHLAPELLNAGTDRDSGHDVIAHETGETREARDAGNAHEARAAREARDAGDAGDAGEVRDAAESARLDALLALPQDPMLRLTAWCTLANLDGPTAGAIVKRWRSSTNDIRRVTEAITAFHTIPTRNLSTAATAPPANATSAKPAPANATRADLAPANLSPATATPVTAPPANLSPATATPANAPPANATPVNRAPPDLARAKSAPYSPRTDAALRRWISRHGWPAVRDAAAIAVVTRGIDRRADLDGVASQKPPLVLADLAINGTVLDGLGIRGPRIGEVLRALLEMVLEKPELNDAATLEKSAIALSTGKMPL